MGIQTNIVAKNGNPPISYNILQGESNEFPRNIILDANYIGDIQANLQEQIDDISAKGGVVDIVANKAALDNYDTSKLTDGNIVQVLQDETHNNAAVYYKWYADEQQFEYLGEEEPYYSKDEIDQALSDINARLDGINSAASVENEEISINIP